jgi:hypothetical protein
MRGFVILVGQLGSVSFAALVTTATSSLTFLAFASIIVKLLATNVLSFKGFYYHEMYEESVDYSDLAEAGWEELSEDEVSKQTNKRERAHVCLKALHLRFLLRSFAICLPLNNVTLHFHCSFACAVVTLCCLLGETATK